MAPLEMIVLRGCDDLQVGEVSATSSLSTMPSLRLPEATSSISVSTLVVEGAIEELPLPHQELQVCNAKPCCLSGSLKPPLLQACVLLSIAALCLGLSVLQWT